MDTPLLFKRKVPIPVIKNHQKIKCNLFLSKSFFIFLLILNSGFVALGGDFIYNTITYTNGPGPICSGTSPGTINGWSDVGFLLSYQWEQSTTSAFTGFSNISGETNENYIPGTLTQTIWLRRVAYFLINGLFQSYSNVVEITVTPLPSANISYSSSPYCSDGGSVSVTFSGTLGGTYSSTGGLSLNSSSGLVNLNSSTPATYTVTYTIPAGGGCALYSTDADITIYDPGSWTGAANTDWNNTGNWPCGAIPNSSTNVTIPGSLSNYPDIVSGTFGANNLTIQSGGSLIISGGTMQIYGSISNSGTFDASTGTVEMKGASAQTIDGSSFYNKTIKNLIVSNTGTGLSVASTAHDTLKITGTLSFGNGSSTLNTGNNITLVSNSDGTANVGMVGSGNTINGNVIVERYINIGSGAGQHAKSWEFLSASTSGQTIKQSWMENGITTSTGYGIIVSGPGGTGAGFDSYSIAPSVKNYNPATNGWTGIANPNISIYNQNGYMVFVRGDRSITAYNQPPNNTTLRTKGTLMTGTLPSISITPDNYASIGNPYASAVDFTLIAKGAGIDDKFYVWDPYLNGSYGFGGYQTLSSTNGWEPVPGGTSIYPSGISAPFIYSGQAFFVHSTSIAPYISSDYMLNFDENNKVATPGNVSRKFEVAPLTKKQFLSASLYAGNSIVDGNTVAFDRNFSDNIDNKDALKLLNSGANFGLKRNGKLLAIEARSPVTITDTLYYNLRNLKKQPYQLRFTPRNMESTGLQAYLIDKFLNASTPISLTDSSFVNISITSTPASFAPDRFEVVFRVANSLPITFISIIASQKNEDILVSWVVNNETTIQQYEVEKSDDGVQFAKVATVEVNNGKSGNYSWLDEKATSGYQYYRVRSEGKDGQVQYTKIVKTLMGNLNSSISVYQNRIVNGLIQIKFRNQPEGVYGVKLINTSGQLIFSKEVHHINGSSSETITTGNQLAKGIYQLEIVKPDGNVQIVNVVN